MVVLPERNDVRAVRRDCAYQSTSSVTAYRTARVEPTRIRFTAVSFCMIIGVDLTGILGGGCMAGLTIKVLL